MSATTSEGEEIHVLFHASKLGRTDVIQSVINSLKKQNKTLDIAKFISTTDDEGNTSLHIASHFGHSDVVRALLNFGADPSILPLKGEFIGKSAYEVANNGAKETFHVYIFEQIAMGHLDTIDLLLKGRIPTDLCDDSPSRDSLLHWACSFDQFPVAELLLKHNVNVDILNAQNQSCLHLACKAGKTNFIDLFLDHGANTSLKDISGKIPLELLPSNIPANPRLQPHDNTDNNKNNNNNNNNNNVQINNEIGTKAKVVPSSLEQNQPTLNDLYIEDNHFESGDESGYDTDTSTLLPDGKPAPPNHHKQNPLPKQLILWPPVQRQIQYTDDQQPSLILSNETPIVICAASEDIDIYPLLTWSGLIDTLNNLGLQSYVHRSTPSGKIRLAIDSNLCPGRHRYEIIINSEEAQLIASDSTGLLYAVHTFVQIIQLHSDFTTSQDYTVNKILIPPMKIIDWPDVANRGVVWSYRNTARTTSSSLKSLVRLFSSLRINQLYLTIDTFNPDSSSQMSTDTIQAICSKVCSLDEISRRHCVDLIPLVTITHANDRLPIDIARNFSSQTITIVLNIESDSSHNSQFSTHWLEKCRDLFTEALSAGHRHVILVCHEFIADFAKVIQQLSMTSGIYVQHYLPQLFFPPKYHSKPITATQYIGVHALALAKDVFERGATLSIYPAMSESDFFYPTLLYKHNCYLHAGASWNRHAFEEILGNGLLDDHTLLRPSLKFFLFSQSGHHEEERLREIVLDLLTTPANGTICATFGDVARVESYLWTLLSSSQYSCDIILPFKKEEIVECLKTFRSILTATGWKATNNTNHSRQEVSSNSNQRTLKTQLDISNHLNNTSSTTENSGFKVKETEEFLHILHLLSILSRSLVLAWNSYDKIHLLTHPKPTIPSSNSSPESITYSDVTLESLLSCLTPGSASDLANMILEGIKLCHQQIWLKKYESFHVRHGFHALHGYLSCHTHSIDEETSSQINSPTSQSLARKRYLKAGKLLRIIDKKRYLGVNQIELPVRCIFQQICKHIPNYSVDVLHNLFDSSVLSSNGTLTPSTHSSPAVVSQPTSSWSLWRR